MGSQKNRFNETDRSFEHTKHMLRIMDKKIYGLIDLRFGGSLNLHVYMYFVNVDRKGFSKIGWMQTFI